MILPESIKFYRCVNWFEGTAHGGDIDLSAELGSGTPQNVFDDVSHLERVQGSVEYRKIYVRNENVGEDSTWEAIKAWISQFTPALNDEVWVTAQGSNSDTQVDAQGYDFVQPNSRAHADVLSLGDLATDGYHHIWLKRIVEPSGPGYYGNSFSLKLESA